MMKLNESGYNLIAKFEGLSLKPYLDSAGVPTIGYGNTLYPDGKRVTMKDKAITKEYALELLKLTADAFAADVNQLVKKPLTQNQFNALTSFAYNVGSDIDLDNIPEGLGDSTLLKKVNRNPNDPTIAAEFRKWNKAGGRVLNGLIKRRQQESEIYFKK